MASKNSNRVGTVWLQHSVPRFLMDWKSGYQYPPSGQDNGQLFLCLSLDLETVETIAHHLQIQAANVYQSKPEDWARNFIVFWDLLNRKYYRDPGELKVDYFKTIGGQQVLTIAKSPAWSRDIYVQDMRNEIGDNITVQSWRNGAGTAQEKYCTREYSVTDVQETRIKSSGKEDCFVTTVDHSKWFVAHNKEIFCFSSINRMVSLPF
ncbi:hypothetical protein HPB49_012474 [Dermacentor silvarum]|uniref:Uncharacterized protein n=1 Tax=Dermacentor silvarum TaxID=543639 RepID=A0ACB8C3L5_DERSI|nr:hypothetical protein HPB49_012474 [Dermacentor silvarum]